MLAPPLIALVLAAPAEVFEEWALTPGAPLGEVVTARALYQRADGDTALLPEALRTGPRPTVHALGLTRPLAVTWGARGWQCALPAGERSSVRLIARVSRAPAAPKMFHTRWPAVTANAAPTRRVAIVPRDWLEGSPEGWTCPDEPDGDVPCVSHERAPGPVLLRVPAHPSRRGSVLLAFTLAGAALAASAWSPSRRAERVVAALGGLAVALSVCLALVGAHAASWGASASLLVPVGVLTGALAPRAQASRVAGAASLVVVPLLAVIGAPAAWAFTLAAMAAMVIAAVALVAVASPAEG